MNRCPCRLWAVIAGVWLVSLSGCQLVPFLPAQEDPQPPKDEANAQALPAPQMADVQIGLGRVMEKRGQLPQAMAAYQEALKQDPYRADAVLRLAILHDQQGRFTESEELYKQALAMQPGSPDAYCNMGYSLYLQHRLPEAEMNLRQALALSPEHRRAHNNLALVLVQTNRRGEALVEFGKGGCNAAEAHANLAFLLMMQRDLPQAATEYERALAIDPSLAIARKGLQETHILRARFNAGL